MVDGDILTHLLQLLGILGHQGGINRDGGRKKSGSSDKLQGVITTNKELINK
jgi:hypothetical protein